MTDIYACLRAALAEPTGQILHAEVLPSYVECAPRFYAARSALPLMHKLDASQAAAALTQNKAAYTLFCAPLLERVDSHGGHLLFVLTHAFYDNMLRVLLRELPASGPLATGPKRASPLAYAQRRMWMLARKAAGEPACPPSAPVQRALLLTAGISSDALKPQALRLRAQEAIDALLTMTKATPPFERPRLERDCAFVGEAAARMLAHAYGCLQED